MITTVLAYLTHMLSENQTAENISQWLFQYHSANFTKRRFTMKALKETPVIKFNPNTLHEVRSLYDLDNPERMEEAIKLLEDWIQKQEHFINKKVERDYLERLIINNKGLMERCKSKLEKLCTFRTIIPEFFEYSDLKEICNVAHYRNLVTEGIMTQLTPENHRVSLARCEKPNHTITEECLLAYIRKGILSREYLSKHDYSAGYILITDLRNVSVMDYVNTITGTSLNKLRIVLQEGYATRLKSIHYLTTSKFIESIIAVSKNFLSAKVSERVHFHSTLESLHKMVPKELLCADYGGSEMPLADLCDLWHDTLASQEHKDFMKSINEFRTDESKRTGEKVSDQYLPGSFRTLTID